MILVTAESLAKKFGDQVILNGVGFSIQDTDRIALVGKNGIGKSTLLEIITGLQSPDQGSVSKAKNCRILYGQQEMTDSLSQTLHDFVISARPELLLLQKEIEHLQHHLTDHPTDAKSLDTLGESQHEFDRLGGFQFDTEVSAILDGLGFSAERFHDPLSTFSGGEKIRINLARLLAGISNCLLLDEPTNHLDIESTEWLEEYLVSAGKACIIVSHDRSFLSRTATAVWELRGGKLDVYPMGFERYLRERDARRDQQDHRFTLQQAEIAKAEDFIRRNMAGQKTKQAQSKLKYLNKLKRIEAPPPDPRGPKFALESSGRSFSQVVKVEDAVLGYDDIPLLQNITFDIYRGEKAGVVGRNGAGKSTFLKTLLGELDLLGGTLRLGNGVDVAYFDQDLSDLDHSLSVLDSLWLVDQSATNNTIRSWLARFGFSGEEVEKSVSALSGGEKTKLSLARLMYHPANFIIMDEPTNHLDIYAREGLEEALREYDGTLLVVSHDRSFLNAVCDKILWVQGSKVRVFAGSYQYAHDKLLEEKAIAAEHAARAVKKAPSGHYLAQQEAKEESRRRNKIKREQDAIVTRIAALETEIERLDQQIRFEISKDDWEKLHTAAELKEKLEEELLQKYDQREQLAQQMQSWNQSA